MLELEVAIHGRCVATADLAEGALASARSAAVVHRIVTVAGRERPAAHG